MRRPFVALDGESYNAPDGSSPYNLIQASDKSFIRDDAGLTTIDCVDYLLSLKNDNPNGIFVGFGFGLDVNYFIRTLPQTAKDRLSRLEFCNVFGKGVDPPCYRFEYIPGKKFILSKGKGRFVDDPKKHGKKSLKFECDKGQSITIYDTWGFFQKSFLDAISEFGIASPKEEIFIAAMKLKRDKFTLEDFDEIFRYNELECDLLVRLMDRVRDRFESVNIELSSWHGAGAVGNALLKREGIQHHIKRPIIESFHEATLHAYFGGRIQTCQNGIFPDVHTYDIVSAYPSIMANLPSLKGMTETYVTEFDPTYPVACYHVEWDIPRDAPINPFPFRSGGGTIDYTFKGQGIYWAYEIEAALKHFPEYIRIHHGFRFDNIDLESRPFAFINEMFEHRKRLKDENDTAQICLKLALNSLYGKMVQSVGGRNGRLPQFQSYIYGGMITAGTRAKMFDAAMQNPTAIIHFATDGICSKVPLTLHTGKSLGEWEYKRYKEAFILKSGIYQYIMGELDDDGKDKGGAKTRGMNPKSIDWEILREIWQTQGLEGKFKTADRKFIGMKSATDARPHCTWQDSPKTINFHQPRYEEQWISDSPLQYRLVPPTHIEGVSLRYEKHRPIIDPALFNPDLEYMPAND